MSRSWKKTPRSGNKKDGAAKKEANHCVRRILKNDLDMNLQFKSYKKAYSSWCICDYWVIMTWKEYLRDYQRYYSWLIAKFPDTKEKELTEEELYVRWVRNYRNK